MTYILTNYGGWEKEIYFVETGLTHTQLNEVIERMDRGLEILGASNKIAWLNKQTTTLEELFYTNSEYINQTIFNVIQEGF